MVQKVGTRCVDSPLLPMATRTRYHFFTASVQPTNIEHLLSYLCSDYPLENSFSRFLQKFATFQNNDVVVVVRAAFCWDWKSRDSLSRAREWVKRSVIKPLFCRVNHYHTDQAKHRRARHKPSIRIVARGEEKSMEVNEPFFGVVLSLFCHHLPSLHKVNLGEKG